MRDLSLCFVEMQWMKMVVGRHDLVCQNEEQRDQTHQGMTWARVEGGMKKMMKKMMMMKDRFFDRYRRMTE